MESENGWILPDGRYIDCEWEGHIKCAKEKFGMRERELEKTAVKVSCMPAMTRALIFLGKEYRPNFLTTRERMTRAQLETIQKYIAFASVFVHHLITLSKIIWKN